MNAAQRRLQRRQLARDWPVGTRVFHKRHKMHVTVSGQSRTWPGNIMVTGRTERPYNAHPGVLKRLPE